MKAFRETADEAARRVSEGTLMFSLFFAIVGISMIITRRYSHGWEFLGTYTEIEGSLVVLVGIAMSVWSFLNVWTCYFRRIYRVLPHMWAQIGCFLLLVGVCLTVSVLPHLVNMPRFYRMISLTSLIVLFLCAHFFHRGVKSAVSKLIKQGEGEQQNG